MARLTYVEGMPWAQLTDFDRGDINDEVLQLVRQAFRENYMLLVRGQKDLTREDCLKLSQAVGLAKVRKPTTSDTQTFFVSNVHKDGKLRDGELLFHSDGMENETLLRAISLYALEVPSKGGETLFANSRQAYQNLPQQLKERIAALKGRNVWNYAPGEGSKRPNPDDIKETTSFAIHPLAWPHPDTGEMVLFASEMFTDMIVGLPRQESDALLEELLSYIRDPAICYAHKWEVGDYLLWDNRAWQHARADFDPKERRHLLRVPIVDQDS